jgi:hypothetical protein
VPYAKSSAITQNPAGELSLKTPLGPYTTPSTRITVWLDFTTPIALSFTSGFSTTRPVCRNYTHVVALDDNPLSKMNHHLTSQGVHDHWNAPIEKQYSRNLDFIEGLKFTLG